MIEALLTKVGLEAGLKTGGRLLGLIIIVAGLLLAGIAFWRGMVAIERMELAARDAAVAERDKHWEAQIATSNAAAEKARADQAIAAARASAEAEAKITGLQSALADLEKANASLPNGSACGLDAGRVRLLNRP